MKCSCSTTNCNTFFWSHILLKFRFKFLYISNRGHNSIARYAVLDDGSLKSLGQTPTEPIPRPFNLDPEGNFLFAGGQKSDKMASYRIDNETGDLTPLKVYEVGKQPMWITILKLGK